MTSRVVSCCCTHPRQRLYHRWMLTPLILCVPPYLVPPPQLMGSHPPSFPSVSFALVPPSIRLLPLHVPCPCSSPAFFPPAFAMILLTQNALFAHLCIPGFLSPLFFSFARSSLIFTLCLTARRLPPNFPHCLPFCLTACRLFSCYRLRTAIFFSSFPDHGLLHAWVEVTCPPLLVSAPALHRPVSWRFIPLFTSHVAFRLALRTWLARLSFNFCPLLGTVSDHHLQNFAPFSLTFPLACFLLHPPSSSLPRAVFSLFPLFSGFLHSLLILCFHPSLLHLTLCSRRYLHAFSLFSLQYTSRNLSVDPLFSLFCTRCCTPPPTAALSAAFRLRTFFAATPSSTRAFAPYFPTVPDYPLSDSCNPLLGLSTLCSGLPLSLCTLHCSANSASSYVTSRTAVVSALLLWPISLSLLCSLYALVFSPCLRLTCAPTLRLVHRLGLDLLSLT